MRTVLFALLCLGVISLVAQDVKVNDAQIEEVGKSPVEAKFSPGGQVRMDLCSGGIELVGKDEGLVRVSYHPQHDDDVKVRLQVAGTHADLRVTGCPHNNFRMTIEVPKSSDLYIRMMAGELEIRDITGDKDVELHFGQLTMDIGKPDDIARVRASVNSGELEASAFDISMGGLFRSFERTGPGKYRVRAHVGAGQLELR
jgi:hypothetical protein